MVLMNLLISEKQLQLLLSRKCTITILRLLSEGGFLCRSSEFFFITPVAILANIEGSGVPGEFRGLEYLHKNYGKLPWETVVMPAARTAREGFLFTKDHDRYFNEALKSAGEDFLVNDPNWALDFAPNGTRLGLGDTITRKRLGDTLETIAKHGADAFYSGPIAETMINAIQNTNGTMVLKDLANYSVALRNTSQIEYRGHTLTSGTSPSSGSVALSILNILSSYDDFFTSEETLNISTHRFDEAIRFAYGQVFPLVLGKEARY